jgi:NAD(P)-dependent dehydrogenase (short-subunit alcohol dehydrogenase family)
MWTLGTSAPVNQGLETKTMETRSVLITGASTGIGRACALRLDRSGWRVFAGVRNQSDGDGLDAEASSHLTPALIDVTDESSIAATREQLEGELGNRGLQGLVNNAGISVQGPIEYLDPDEIRRQFEVNVVGQVMVTQAMLPLVRSGRGRIVFMSSIAGRVRSIPLIAPYSASKKALEAIGEALHYELMPEGIRVALIEPGSIDTPIWSKGVATVDRKLQALPDDGRRRYGSMIRRAQAIASQQARRGSAPERVAMKVEHALTSARPRLRYIVGTGAHISAYAEPFMPQVIKGAFVRRLSRM